MGIHGYLLIQGSPKDASNLFWAPVEGNESSRRASPPQLSLLLRPESAIYLFFHGFTRTSFPREFGQKLGPVPSDIHEYDIRFDMEAQVNPVFDG
jgi:hypothetical protein